MRLSLSPVRADDLGVNATLARTPAALPILASHWSIRPGLTFLNHGSYGAVPNVVLKHQSDLRLRMEQDAVRFFKVDLENLMDDMRARVGAFLGCPGPTLAPMVNATVALATILRQESFRPGDEILVTDHEYMSGINELERICAATGAKVVRAAVPFPATSPDDVVSAVQSAISPRTRFMMVSWITSATSLIFPIRKLIALGRHHGITTLVDGTHAPGQIPVDIADLNPDYFVGSGHKWLSAPKGTGFLYVPLERQANFRPICLSSRAHKVRPERPLFLRDFDYMGTDDYSGILSVPAAIDFMGSVLPGGWNALYAQNHDLVIRGVEVLQNALGLPVCGPESMIGTMATLVLPDPPAGSRPTKYDDALQDALVERHGVVVPIWQFQPLGATKPLRVLRISAQVYNSIEDYHRLADALGEELTREKA